MGARGAGDRAGESGPSEPTGRPRIFISYRREDSEGHTGWLFDTLVSRFGDEQVFMDIDAIPLGVDFTRVITEAVASCDVLIAVIGSRWLELVDASGNRRLDDPNDFVRLEVRAALERDVRVIPAVVHNAQMPRADELPADLAGLAVRNAIFLRADSWKHGVDRLVRAVEEVGREKAERERLDRENAERERVGHAQSADEGGLERHALRSAGLDDAEQSATRPDVREPGTGTHVGVVPTGPETAPHVEPEPEPAPATSPVQTPAPVQQPSPTQEHKRRRAANRSRRIRPVWFAAGIAGTTAAVALGVFLTAGGNGRGTPTGGPVFTWSTAAAPGEFGGSGDQEMHGIAAIGSNRAVAVGYDEDKDRKVPAAWSYDSAEWKRVLAPRFGDVGSGDGSVGAFHGVAADGETVVAVGVAGPSQAEEDALVWTFFDDAWHRVCREECGNSVNGGGSDGQGMWAVVNRSNGGFVAVGYDVIKEEKTSFDAAVWTSPDGRRWGRVPADPDVFGGAGNQVMRAVTETRSNLLVAVGVDDLTGAVWTSPDGQAWNRVGVDAFDPLPESDRTELRGIIEQEDNQLVAVGIDRQKRNVRAAAWVSSGDLGEWQRIQTSAFPRDRIDQHALGAASNGQRTVAVGYDHVPRDSDHRVAAAWLVDGETVQPIQNRDFRGPGNREINAAALLADGRLVAVGDGPSPEGPANEQDARVWIATPRH